MIGQHETKHGQLVGLLRWKWHVLLAAALSAVSCATSEETSNPTSTSSGGSGGTITTSTSASTETGGGGTTASTSGSNTWPCGQDCSKIPTKDPCLMPVCNDGTYLGPIGVCTIVEAPAGTLCDDGQFCTVSDACDGKGECQGGSQNDCGIVPPECKTVICDPLINDCTLDDANEGASCTPIIEEVDGGSTQVDLCQINGECTAGKCVGEPKDCSFSPDAECNLLTCNPANGKCEGTPDTSKNGVACTLTGDLCRANRTCQDGLCAGGVPKDCSAFTAGCTVGVCDGNNGACTTQDVPVGGQCFDGIDQCHTGVCDANLACQPVPVADGTPCDDFNACTGTDTCTAGTCAGVATAGCTVYLNTSFESCPAGFALAGDWECGTPITVGPSKARTGSNVLATKIGGNYSAGDAYATCTATAPSIDLTSATAPKLSFWVWMDTEGSSYDGFHLEASTNNGTSYSLVSTVQPTYNLTVGSQPAWGGHQASSGWQSYAADLSSFVGQQVLLRFAFRTDSSGNYPGVYIDDMVVAEASAMPLAITTSSLPDAIAGNPYAATLAKTGGTTGSLWSITGGISNWQWLTIDAHTGALGGTPTTANIGAVSVEVKVEEPAVPSNFAKKLLTFNVVTAIFFEGFEGTCPNGWTLGGDWQCGTPSSVGPATAYSGSHCLATQLASNYNYSQSWTTCVATSPDIPLTTANPKLAFRMWLNTEGSSYDGANLKVSADGGTTYSIVNNVTPAYNLTSVGGEVAWGSDQSSKGWQLVEADLSSYVAQTIRLRFAFRSDSAVNRPGVYIDDVMISDH